jgi:autotransporter-associated beta strand protein
MMTAWRVRRYPPSKSHRTNMNIQTTRSNRGVLLRSIKATFMAGVLPLLVLMFTFQSARAGSATWKQSPGNSDWNTASNWNPRMVPNGSSDTATFAVSNFSDISFSAATEVDGIIFNPGASSYTISVPEGIGAISISGAGITDNSGVSQTFVTGVGGYSYILFSNNSTAGDAVFNNTTTSGAYGGIVYFSDTANAGSASFTNSERLGFSPAGGRVSFADSSSAGSATFINKGNDTAISFGTGGDVEFVQTATAANSLITNEGAAVSGEIGGTVLFVGNSTAGSATIVCNGGQVAGAGGGNVQFSESARGDHAILVANGGTNGGDGGKIGFVVHSKGIAATVKVFGNGNLDISGLAGEEEHSVTIGSLEGDGQVFMGGPPNTRGNPLTVKTNVSTTFSGVIQGSNSFTKTGGGTLTLTGANTYTGGTNINQGKLVVNNRNGSGTGSSGVSIYGGTLAGKGIIAGSVSSYGPGAVLSPGAGIAKPGVLIIGGPLNQYTGSIYQFLLNTESGTANGVVANNVLLYGEPQFSATAKGDVGLPQGVVFTVINNTSAAPITGTFSNLPDGSTVSVGSNTFQANYEGGDGNDLTLTVVP